jgi:hypothetical protein
VTSKNADEAFAFGFSVAQVHASLLAGLVAGNQPLED